MIDLKLTVEHGGDRWIVAPSPACLIACERHFGKPAPELFANPSFESLAWLAWEQTRRDGRDVQPFDTWIDGLVDLGTEVDDDGPLPDTP